MIEIPSEADINCSAAQIFELITDLDGQQRWLTRSSAFRGTIEISNNPVTLGTTYVEPGPLGVRNGEVVELERPTRIAFHQPMRFKLGLGTIDILMRYTLIPAAGSTQVKRLVTLSISWPLRVFQPLVVRAFRAESDRTLAALNRYADALPDG
jgi:uncharacterized protein YndB with AHSA1/START domain